MGGAWWWEQLTDTDLFAKCTNIWSDIPILAWFPPSIAASSPPLLIEEMGILCSHDLLKNRTGVITTQQILPLRFAHLCPKGMLHQELLHYIWAPFADCCRVYGWLKQTHNCNFQEQAYRNLSFHQERWLHILHWIQARYRWFTIEAPRAHIFKTMENEAFHFHRDWDGGEASPWAFCPLKAQARAENSPVCSKAWDQVWNICF